MSRPQLPERLRREVLEDLRPVPPLPPPAVRAARLALWAVALLVMVPSLLPLRDDAPSLGFGLVWGAAVFEALLGTVLIGLALREAVPGQGLGPARSMAAFAAGVVAQALVGLLTWRSAPPLAAAAAAHHAGMTCLSAQVALALPGLAIGFWLVIRALPLRPGWTGALLGLGAGLVADGTWHLICPRADLGHVLVWHGGATALLIAAGWWGVRSRLLTWRPASGA
jgi:hypothetical protein